MWGSLLSDSPVARTVLRRARRRVDGGHRAGFFRNGRDGVRGVVSHRVGAANTRASEECVNPRRVRVFFSPPRRTRAARYGSNS